MRLLRVLVFVLLAAVAGLAQSQMSSGDIKGRVVDSTGAVLPNVSVTLTNIDTGVARSATTDQSGDYRFFILQPGSYELRVEAPGFSAYTRRPIQLTVGQSLIVEAPLQPVGIQQEILVQTELPIIEPERTQQSDTITTERIENLPINERNFLDFAKLTPGVTDAHGLVTFTLPQAPTSGLSFLGQGGRYNSVTIDGADNNDNAVASVRSTISQEAVQEFQINRANYSAEFGRAAGGLINIVSKSGTNRLGGTVFGFFRDQALDARNPFAFGPNRGAIDPPFSRAQAGFTLGGPIRQDQTFFFLSYEGLRQRESRFVTFMEDTRFFQLRDDQRTLLGAMSSSPQLAPLAAQLSARLMTTPQTFPDTIKLLTDNSGVFPFKNNTNTASLRLDHTYASGHQVFGRLSLSDTDTAGGAFGGLKAPSRSANYNIQDYGFVIGDTHTFGSERINEFRFQFANRDYAALSADPFGPEITINGLAFLGRDFFLPSTRKEKRYQFLDNFTFVSGRHVVKVGGDFHYLPFDTVTEVFLGGRFIFGEQIPLSLIIDSAAGPGTSNSIRVQMPPAISPFIDRPITSIQSFNLGLPLVYQQGFGDPRASFTNKMLSGYLNDNFSVNPELTLNIGVRYDVELQPDPIHRDKNNWAPRIGFAYNLDDVAVIRGGYGIFYSPIYEAIAFVGRVLNGQQISQVFLPLTGLPPFGITATSAQVWGLAKARGILGTRSITAADIAPLGVAPGITPPVLLAADANIVNPYSQQFSLGVDQEIPGGINLSVDYLGNRGVKLIRSRNVNLRQVGTNQFGPTFGPINPRILQDNRAESSGSSIYHGLAFNLVKRYSQNYQFQASYTYSKAIDDLTDFITDLQPANQLDLRGERGLSSFDQRHRFVVSGVFQGPEIGIGLGRVLSGFTLSPIVTYDSGHPFNILLGQDANGDTQANTDRPLHAGRNTGAGPDYVSVDLRIARAFAFGENIRLEGIFEAFNLFNRVNYSGVNNIVGPTPLPSYHVEGRSDVPANAPLGFTSAFDPRQIQLGVKLKF